MNHPATRRLAAICFADIVGYTTLASENEDAALRLVHLFQEEVRAALEPFGGRLTKFLGDGVLLEFTSADGALRAALSLEREFARRARAMGLDTALRIGVHVGEVTVAADGDLYGDGINIASRLHGLAGAGQVIVSEDVRRLLRGRPEFRLKPLGPRQIKGLEQPIEVFSADEVRHARRGARLRALLPAASTRAATDPTGHDRPHLIRRRTPALTGRKLVRVTVAYGLAAGAVTVLVIGAGRWAGLPPGTIALILVGMLAVLPLVALVILALDPRRARGEGGQVEPALPPESGAPDPEIADAWTPLPSAGTEFIGRRGELRQLGELLSNPQHRLITIVGPGGAGKTRLAVHAVQNAAAAFRDGVAYIALSSLPARQLLPQALAHALGVSLSRREDTLAEVLEFLRGKELLLLLDNFDELTAEAGVLASILQQAPGVRLLVTTRERLNLLEETLLSVEGLANSGADSDAVRLFVAAARRHDGGFTTEPATVQCIQRISSLVGGMPLALELAAAWVRVLSCEEIRAEVERGLDILTITAPGVPARHRSMRVMFDASWRLLVAEQQRATARLSVMRSSFDRHTAVAVAEVDAALLRTLLDKSMLTGSSGRFVMLEVVRQYAGERLAENADEEMRTRARHARLFADLLDRLEPATVRSEPDALSHIADAIDEIRAAWTFAVHSRDVASLLRAVHALFHFYDARGWIREALGAFDSAAEALEAKGDAHDPDLPMRASLAARLDVRRGVLHSRLGELDRAEVLLQRGAAAARELGESREVVFALNRLGANRLLAGRYDDAAAAHREARALAEIIQDRHGIAWSLTHLGNLAWTRGEYDDATRYYTRALDILREDRDRNGMWTAVNNLGAIAYVRKDYDEAHRRFSEGVTLQRELRNQRSTAMLLHNLGCVDMAAGAYAPARDHLQQALAISERMGYRRMSAQSLLGLADLSLEENDLDAAGAAVQRALQLAATANSQPVCLEALLRLARLRARQGDTAGAGQLARVVVQHPAGEEDARTKARQLLDEVACEEGDGPGADLEQLIAALLERETAAIDT